MTNRNTAPNPLKLAQDVLKANPGDNASTAQRLQAIAAIQEATNAEPSSFEKRFGGKAFLVSVFGGIVVAISVLFWFCRDNPSVSAFLNCMCVLITLLGNLLWAKK